jgi:hypothetical protein
MHGKAWVMVGTKNLATFHDTISVGLLAIGFVSSFYIQEADKENSREDWTCKEQKSY